MITLRSVPTSAVLLGTALLLAGCGKQPEPQAPVPVQNAAEPDDRADREAAQRAAREAEEARRRAMEEARRTRSTLEEMVFFDYDMSNIRPDAQAILGAKLPVLRDTPAIRMRIEGHADERGSTEYNLALGMRRAMSVKEYFQGFGLDGARFEVLSYGEERPLASGHDESAWGRNRRAEFVITAGMPVTTPQPEAGTR